MIPDSRHEEGSQKLPLLCAFPGRWGDAHEGRNPLLTDLASTYHRKHPIRGDMAFLCRACCGIFEAGTYSGEEPSESHHSSETAFRAAVAAGCWICSLVDCHPTSSFRPGISYRLENIEATGRVKTYALDFDCALNSFELFSCPANGSHIAAWLEVDDRALCAPSTGDIRVLNLASRWLQTCLDHHPNCQHEARNGAYRPTRLLELTDSIVKLVDTAHFKTPNPPQYASLSHCWGASGPSYLLSSETMPELRAGVSVSGFDATFQDAFVVIKHLGIRYLWIDCYCIIQGSDDLSRLDWAAESLNMDKVYMNSVLNLGSVHGNDARAGCFIDRSPPHISNVRISWSPDRGGQEDLFELRLHQESENRIRNLYGGPLFQRGWVVQEAYLAQRALYFAADGVYWRCPSFGHVSDAVPYEMTHLKDYTLRKRLPINGSLFSMPPSRVRTWILNFYYDALEEYSRCDLSCADEDKIIAFAGIGNHVSDRLADRYSHGFLQSTLPYSLCWHPDEGIDYEDKSYPAATLSRAPSWHWASSDRPLKMEQYWYRRPDDYHALITILPVHGNLAPTVEATTALICLGRLIPTRSLRCFDTYNEHCPAMHTSIASESQRSLHIFNALGFNSSPPRPESGSKNWTAFKSSDLYFMPVCSAWPKQDRDRGVTIIRDCHTNSTPSVDEDRRDHVESIYQSSLRYYGLILLRNSDGSFRRLASTISTLSAYAAVSQVHLALLGAKPEIITIV